MSFFVYSLTLGNLVDVLFLDYEDFLKLGHLLTRHPTSLNLAFLRLISKTSAKLMQYMTMTINKLALLP